MFCKKKVGLVTRISVAAKIKIFSNLGTTKYKLSYAVPRLRSGLTSATMGGDSVTIAAAGATVVGSAHWE